ncbi:MAG: LysM peptidoglycan-binding domain-containing protein [Parabacteroides sp.]|nr:LysM peptidoglycan-binding domain-containing protein [Parabacteroides sp.]
MSKFGFYILLFILFFNGLNIRAQQRGTQRAPAATEETNVFYHTVEPGQTVYAIATMYGVTVEDIYRLNPESKGGIRSGAKLVIPQKKETAAGTENAETGYRYHTIAPKETLYSLSLKYDVPAEEIIRANPGLSVQTFSFGKTIRIPDVPSEGKIVEQVKTVTRDTKYVVKKNDTFYSIERRFDIPKEELVRRNPSLKNGLKAGATIYIPEKIEVVVATTTEAPQEYEVNALLNSRRPVQRVNVVKTALLLPFMANEPSNPNNARFLEYYEGYLLAIDSLKKKGYSVDLYVYDTGNGTGKIREILEKPEMKEMNLIVGAVQNDQIGLIADFAKKYHIKYVIPFASKNDEVLGNPAVFQINTPHSYLYAKASHAASRLFADRNIVLITGLPGEEEKAEFVKALKTELNSRQIPFKEYAYTGQFATAIETQLSKDRANVIIPASGSATALTKILPPLRQLAETKPEYSLTLFGYPEWQTYTKEHLEDFYALDTYIYSNFYADNFSPEVKRFYQDYKTWYSKSLANTYPKYGMLGFDTGLFFTEAIHRYGENFENSLSLIDYPGLQTGFVFDRVNNWGGFINTNLFIVHYKNDFTVSRTAGERL